VNPSHDGNGDWSNPGSCTGSPDRGLLDATLYKTEITREGYERALRFVAEEKTVSKEAAAITGEVTWDDRPITNAVIAEHYLYTFGARAGFSHFKQDKKQVEPVIQSLKDFLDALDRVPGTAARP
jgi:hypothetical protein